MPEMWEWLETMEVFNDGEVGAGTVFVDTANTMIVRAKYSVKVTFELSARQRKLLPLVQPHTSRDFR